MAGDQPMDPMEAIKQTFFQECEEQLAELESGLLAIEGGDGGSETVNAVFRAVHSIKGGAGAFGLDALVRFAHVFETSLDMLRSDRLAPEPHVLKVLLRAADVLADLVRATRDGGTVDPARGAALAEDLRKLGTADAPAPEPAHEEAGDPDGMDGLVFQPLQIASPDPAAQTWIVRFRPLPALYAKANEAALLLRELGSLGAAEVTLDASGLPDLAELDPEGAYLTWAVKLTTEQPRSAILAVFEFVEGDCEIDVQPEEAAAPEPPPEAEFDVMALIREVQGAPPPAPEPPALPPAAPAAAAPAAVVAEPPAAPGRRHTAGRAHAGGQADHPCRPGPGGPADRLGGRVGDQPGDAGPAGDGIRPDPLLQCRDVGWRSWSN
ncbi:MAG: Hpt domain-containing protein [Acetobacteraceae bacterium]